MDLDQEFRRLMGWLETHRAHVAEAGADLAATERLLSSAEYELAQLKRSLAKLVPGVEGKPAAAAASMTAGPIDPSAFERKLRAAVRAKPAASNDGSDALPPARTA